MRLNLDRLAAAPHEELMAEWRDEFKRRHTGDNDNSKNTAHRRARKTLISLKLANVDDDFYTLGDKATCGDKHKTIALHKFSSGDTTDTCL